MAELHNAGDATATLDSLFLHDDKGAHEDALALSGSLGAGEYLLLCRKVDFEFKIGGGDTISISTSGEVVDTTPACCADSDERTYGRVHGTSEFAVLATPRRAPPTARPRCWRRRRPSSSRRAASRRAL